MDNRKRKHVVNLDEEEESQLKKKKCEICLKLFNRNDRLQSHILNNHVQQKCSECDKEFPSRIELMKHKKKIHKKKKQRCMHCQKNFLRADRLQSHILNNHVQQRCNECGENFPSRIELMKHKKKIHQRCMHCQKVFLRADRLEKHVLNNHMKKKCMKCGEQFSSNIELQKHRRKYRKYKICKQQKIITRGTEEGEVSNKRNQKDDSSEQSAFNKLLLTKTWRIRGAKDPLTLMRDYKKNISHHLIGLVMKNPRKFYIVMQLTLVKKNREGNHERLTTYFRSSIKTILRSSQINEMFEESSQQINTSFENFIKDGSGWVLESIDYIMLYTAVYEPIRGKSFIPTPTSIMRKKCVVNIQNDDEKCFEYSIIASQHYSEIDTTNSSRPNQYDKWLGKYNFEGCTQPMQLDNISKFEKNNNMAINVYYIQSDGKLVSPLRITQKDVKLEEYVNLLLIEAEDRCHYTWIRNLDNLLQYDRHFKKFCPFCCQGFDKRYKKDLSEHLHLCRKYGGQRVQIPPKGKNIVEFKEIHKW